jgi:hypothetical protein
MSYGGLTGVNIKMKNNVIFEVIPRKMTTFAAKYQKTKQ